MRRVHLIGSLLVAMLVSVGTVFAQTDNPNFTVPLSGDAEVPVRQTQARGVAIFKLSPDGNTLSYRLNVANIENVFQAHIHMLRVPWGAVGSRARSRRARSPAPTW